MKEYVTMCDEYGIELTDEHYNLVKSIANENGEVVDTLENTVNSSGALSGSQE